MSVRCYGLANFVSLDGATSDCVTTFRVGITSDNHSICIIDHNTSEIACQIAISAMKILQLSTTVLALSSSNDSASDEHPMILRFQKTNELKELLTAIKLCRSLKNEQSSSIKKDDCMSEFDARTEQASAIQYFQFYGYLSQQQNMMQDYVRTSTYQKAIHANAIDFQDKVVLDVGAGSGILSFFALQAGARHVYAVEASSMAVHCAELIRCNNLSNRATVIASRVEDIQIPEEVDIIISEPMGYMLVNERMLESYIHARKFMKKGGKMFPSRGDLHIALFNDEALFIEQNSKANFWCQESFHGVNLSCLRTQALLEIFKQPIVDTWHVNCLMSGSSKWTINFEKDPESKLHNIEIPFELFATKSGHVHGIACWFDVAFIGSTETVWLSTAPTEPLTHWYQVRCLLQRPLMVLAGQQVSGRLLMVANERQSYDLNITVRLGNVEISNTLDLKNPLFRYTGTSILPPSGSASESPSDALMQNSAVAVNQDFGGLQTLGNVAANYGVATMMNIPAQMVPMSQQAANANLIDIIAHPHPEMIGIENSMVNGC